MKKLFILLAFIICATAAFSQKNVYRSNGANTIVDARWGAALNLYVPVYLDTTQANDGGNIGIDSCGALISTRIPDQYWRRACNPKRWEAIGGGTSNTDSLFGVQDNVASANRSFSLGGNNFTYTGEGNFILGDANTILSSTAKLQVKGHPRTNIVAFGNQPVDGIPLSMFNVDTVTSANLSSQPGRWAQIDRRLAIQDNNLTISDKSGSIINLGLQGKDSTVLNSQGGDLLYGVRGSMFMGKYPGFSGRTVYNSGTSDFDAVPATLAYMATSGGTSSLNNIRMRGYYSGVSSYLNITNAGDTVDNWMGFISNGQIQGKILKAYGYYAGSLPSDSGWAFYAPYSNERNYFAGNVAIGGGNTGPTNALEVAGQFKLVNGTQSNGYVLTSDATGLSSWQPASAGASSLQAVTDVGNITNNEIRVKRKDSVGTRFSYDWTTGVFSSWTPGLTTTTATASAGKTNFSGGALNLNNSITQSFFIGVENWTISQSIVCNTKSNTSLGFAFRLAGQVGSAPDAFAHFLLADTAGYLAYTNSNSLPVYNTSANSRSTYNFVWTTGDTLDAVIQKINRVITISLTNKRNGSIMKLAIPECTVTVATLGLYFYGGSWDYIGNFNLTYNEVYRPLMAFLGDSNMWGVSASSIGQKYASQVMSSIGGGYVMMSAPFEQSQQGWQRLNDVITWVKPTIAVWAYGVNDRNSAVNIDSFSARTQRFVRGCIDSSIQVALVNLVPQTAGTVVVFNDTLQAIATRYNVRYIDIYSQLVGVGTAMNTIFNAGDGVHINANGHNKVAPTIIDNLSYLMTTTPPISLNPLPTEYNPSFYLSVNSRGELTRSYADSSNQYIRNITPVAGISNSQTAGIFITGSVDFRGSGNFFYVEGNGNFANPNFKVENGTTTVSSFSANGAVFTVTGSQTSVTANWLQFTNGAYLLARSSNPLPIRVNIAGPGQGTRGVFVSTENSQPGPSYLPFAAGTADSIHMYLDRWGGPTFNRYKNSAAIFQFKGAVDTALITAKATTDKVGIGIADPISKFHVVGAARITDTLLVGTKSYFGSLTSTPSARIHIAAQTSTAGTAPLKFSGSATLLGTPEDGAIEYDGLNLRFTNATTERGYIIESRVFTGNNLTLSLAQGYSDYFYGGGVSATWSLPAVTGTSGQTITVSNIGAGTLTVDVTGAGSTIFTTTTVASVNLVTGDVITFKSNGTVWKVQ